MTAEPRRGVTHSAEGGSGTWHVGSLPLTSSTSAGRPPAECVGRRTREGPPEAAGRFGTVGRRRMVGNEGRSQVRLRRAAVRSAPLPWCTRGAAHAIGGPGWCPTMCPDTAKAGIRTPGQPLGRRVRTLWSASKLPVSRRSFYVPSSRPARRRGNEQCRQSALTAARAVEQYRP